ncbi:MAG: hypothetical protein IKW74_01025, partial [Thermoguttaceae bacterium]|nr:hypothetical protein [Thermoguttaceae bacterium]
MDKNIEPESKSTGQKKVRPGKNEWIDTAGYTHRYFVDPRKEISPRVTWSVLLLVTLLASIIGWFCVRDISPEKQSPRHVVQFPASGKIFMVRRPPITLKEDNPFLIATGQDNTFLIADSDEIAV